jgi:hypothetical protein
VIGAVYVWVRGSSGHVEPDLDLDLDAEAGGGLLAEPALVPAIDG